MKDKKIFSVVLGVLIMGLCFVQMAFTVEAEQIAGYHEKNVTEESAADSWYAIGRGTYLAYGQAKVMRAGTRKVSISGGTMANSICDELSLALYLDESSDSVNYGTIGVYHYSDTNDACVSGYEEDIKVTSGYYYSVRGVHRVTEGNVTETTDTCTDAITAS